MNDRRNSMARGYVIFGDLDGKLDVLRVAASANAPAATTSPS
jgi:hypothetical protein